MVVPCGTVRSCISLRSCAHRWQVFLQDQNHHGCCIQCTSYRPVRLYSVGTLTSITSINNPRSNRTQRSLVRVTRKFQNSLFALVCFSRRSADGSIGISLADTKQGVVVHKVVPGSPAQQAGILVGDVISAVAGKRMKRLQRAKVEAFILAQPQGAPIAFSMKRSAEPQVVRAPEPADATCYARAPSQRSSSSSSSSSSNSKHNQHVRAGELHAFVCIPATFGSAVPAYPGVIHDLLVLPDLQLCDSNSLLEHWNKRWRHKADSDSAALQQQQRMLVALRGGCFFEQKAANAQLIGANSLLVIDTQVCTACNHTAYILV
jgi:PDZ domain